MATATGSNTRRSSPRRCARSAATRRRTGFLARMRRIRDALNMSVAERKQRGVAMAGFWTRQTKNTLDRATAMMPRMLYERLDELGIDFAIIYPTAGLGLPRINDDETRRAVIRAYNIVIGRLFPRPRRPDDPGRDHPDAHARRGDRRARIRDQAARLEGRHVRQRHARGQLPAAEGIDPEIARFAVWYDVLGIDSDYDYDPVWAEMPRARHRADLPQRRPQLRPAACRRPTSSTTTSAISPPPATPSPRRSSSAA